MVTSQFDFFFDVIRQKRAALAVLKEAEREREHDQLAAWFEFMAMGHPEATEQDRQSAQERLRAAEDDLVQARSDLAEANRRLVIFEDYLRQCSPA